MKASPVIDKENTSNQHKQYCKWDPFLRCKQVRIHSLKRVWINFNGFRFGLSTAARHADTKPTAKLSGDHGLIESRAERLIADHSAPLILSIFNMQFTISFGITGSKVKPLIPSLTRSRAQPH